MAQAQPVPFPRIVRNPRILGGEPTVAGTRVSVRIIVVTYRQDGEIGLLLDAFPMLDRTTNKETQTNNETNQPENKHNNQKKEETLENEENSGWQRSIDD